MKLRYFIVFVLTVLTVLLLYTFRSLDDNRLTSWESVFGAASIVRILVLLVPGSIVALILSRNPLPERYPLIFLFVLSFISAALLWPEPEMNIDASRYFTQAKYLELYGAGYFWREWGHTITAWTDLPLMPFIYGLVFRYAGETRLYIQIVNTLFFSLTVMLSYLTGKALWNRETGFTGGIFLLGLPFMLVQVPLMLVDTPTMFFFMLAAYSFIEALERGGNWIAASSVSLFLVLFSKYSAWLMLSLLVVITAVKVFEAYRSHGRSMLKKYIIRSAIPFMAAGIAAAAVMGLKYDVFSSQINLLFSFQKPGLARWGESYTSTFLFQVHPFITAAAVSSIYNAWKKRDPKWFIAGWLMALLIALDIKRSRYSIITFPLLSLMAAYGLDTIKDKDLKKYIAFSAAACSVIIAVCAYLPFLQQTSARNLQNAGAFLNTLPGKNVEVVTLPQKDDEINIAVYVPLLDIYTGRNIHYTYKNRYSPSPDEISISPFRFSWEYRNPLYYDPPEKPLTPDTAVAIISGEPLSRLPEECARKVSKFRNSKAFSISDEVFDHQTFVTVYY